MIAARQGLLVTLIVCLAGCAAQMQKDKMSNALNPWLGETIASYVAAHGDPTSTVKLAEGKSAFRWVLTGQGAGGVVPVAGAMVVVPPRQLTCTVVFTATTSSKTPELKDWIINNSNWEGAC